MSLDNGPKESYAGLSYDEIKRRETIRCKAIDDELKASQRSVKIAQLTERVKAYTAPFSEVLNMVKEKGSKISEVLDKMSLIDKAKLVGAALVTAVGHPVFGAALAASALQKTGIDMINQYKESKRNNEVPVPRG